VKPKWKILIVIALSFTIAAVGWFVWLRERPVEAFVRVVGFTPPPSVTNLRAMHAGGFQTWEDVLSFRIASTDFPLLLQSRPFTQVSKSDMSLGIDIEQLDQPPVTNPIYFETPEQINEQNVPIYTIRTNPERTSVIFRRIDGQ
jgi:hypothetical protein